MPCEVAIAWALGAMIGADIDIRLEAVDDDARKWGLARDLCYLTLGMEKLRVRLVTFIILHIKLAKFRIGAR